MLLDENNTGNGAASMFEVAIAGGGTTGLRTADRAELWYFLGRRRQVDGKRDVAAGDMMFVPAGGAREVAATQADVACGARRRARRPRRLGARRRTADAERRAAASAAGARCCRRARAKTYGPGDDLRRAAIVEGAPFAASILDARRGRARSPSTCTRSETELLYMLAGAAR